MGSSKRPSSSLQSPDMTEQTVESLGSTLGSFASRIKRKLKEQESRDEKWQREAERRHARMLQALNTIRRALQETGQIQLGSRFSLELQVSDWEGWPRLSLMLVDSLLPERNDHAFVVTAHDRKGMGSIELRMKSGLLLGQVHLCNEGELDRLPFVLKKAVRAFLDLVADYILNPLNPDDWKVESELLENEQSAASDEHSEKLSREDVFSDDDYSVHDNSVDGGGDARLTISFDKAEKGS